jgi:hypothetical protein
VFALGSRVLSKRVNEKKFYCEYFDFEFCFETLDDRGSSRSAPGRKAGRPTTT